MPSFDRTLKSLQKKAKFTTLFFADTDRKFALKRENRELNIFNWLFTKTPL